MIDNTYIDVQFRGENFSPNKLMELTGLPLEVLVEPGDIAKIGRYKGKPSPFGLALLKIESTQDAISEWCDRLLDRLDALEEANVGEIIFDIESSGNNYSNFSITPELSNKLSRLKAVINFSEIPEVEVDEFIEKILLHLKNSSISNKDLILKDLIRIGKMWSKEQMSSKYSYAILIYLFENLNSKEQIEIESLQKYIDEYQEHSIYL